MEKKKIDAKKIVIAIIMGSIIVAFLYGLGYVHGMTYAALRISSQERFCVPAGYEYIDGHCYMEMEGNYCYEIGNYGLRANVTEKAKWTDHVEVGLVFGQGFKECE